MREAITQHLAQSGLSKERVGAAVSAIMDATTMRVGSEAYASKSARGETAEGGSQDSFGASSLRKSHVTVEGDTVSFKFPGKSKKDWERSITDPALAKTVTELMKQPGERLMQFQDEKGSVKPFTETHAQEYLRPHGLTPKNLRTYHATRVASEFLHALPAPKTTKEAEKNVTEAMLHTSKHLGNTPEIARKSYVNPSVIEHYLSSVKDAVNMSDTQAKEFDFDKLLKEVGKSVRQGKIGTSTPYPDPDEDDPDDDEAGLDETENERGEEKSSPARFSLAGLNALFSEGKASSGGGGDKGGRRKIRLV